MKKIYRKKAAKQSKMLEKQYGKPRIDRKEKNYYRGETGTIEHWNTGHQIVTSRSHIDRANTAIVAKPGTVYEGGGSFSADYDRPKGGRLAVMENKKLFQKSYTTNKNTLSYNPKASAKREAKDWIKSNTSSWDVAKEARIRTVENSQAKRGKASGKWDASTATRGPKYRKRKASGQ